MVRYCLPLLLLTTGGAAAFQAPQSNRAKALRPNEAVAVGNEFKQATNVPEPKVMEELGAMMNLDGVVFSVST